MASIVFEALSSFLRIFGLHNLTNSLSPFQIKDTRHESRVTSHESVKVCIKPEEYFLHLQALYIRLDSLKGVCIKRHL